MKTLESIYKELKQIIDKAYEEGVDLQEAEKLAALTLSVRMDVTDAIKTADLDARMKKHGAKAIRAKEYLDEIAKHDKKPTESQLDAIVSLSKLVEAAEYQFYEADVYVNQLESYLGIFADAHIYFRGISKGSYG